MKKNTRILFVAFATLVALGLAAFLNAQSAEKERQNTRADLAQAIQNSKVGESVPVDLSQITDFSWDTVYIFGPYTAPEQIDASLDQRWAGARLTEIETSDRISLLVFTQKGQVVQYFEFPRSEGDFASAASTTGYPIAEAQFIAAESGQLLWAFANP